MSKAIFIYRQCETTKDKISSFVGYICDLNKPIMADVFAFEDTGVSDIIYAKHYKEAKHKFTKQFGDMRTFRSPSFIKENHDMTVEYKGW